MLPQCIVGSQHMAVYSSDSMQLSLFYDTNLHILNKLEYQFYVLRKTFPRSILMLKFKHILVAKQISQIRAAAIFKNQIILSGFGS